MIFARQLGWIKSFVPAIGAFALLSLSAPAYANTPACLSADSDSDGNGWGWENQQSCVVPFADNSAGWPGCLIAGSDPDGDGYGWENTQTCVVTVLTPRSPDMQHPTCESNNSDPDGDGWGWENYRSCIVVYDEPESNGQFPQCALSDSDPDNDGWGWENNRSCIVAAQDTQENEVPDIGAALPGPDYPECQLSTSDPDGDGWGWEDNNSCTMTANSTADESDDPTTPPVTNTQQPVCLSTASDPYNTGYGYEYNRSCIVVEGVSKTADDPLFNTEFCDSWAEIAYGNLRIQNNTWNDSAVYSDRWSQCIELQQNSAGDPVATWKFNWLDRSEGDQAQVKSYPQVYYGRKNERNFTGTPEQTGLPRPINEIDRYRIDYAFSTTGEAEYNVALESFFHSSCDARDDNKQFEMMVWVGVPGEKTPGTQVSTATIDGTVWKVFANPILTWGYVAFVAEETTPSGQLDWNAFIEWSQENSASLGLGSMQNTCMGAIEMGTETFWGELEFRLDRFDITRY